MTSSAATMKKIRTAVQGKAAAFRLNHRLQPVGGEGTKVFPPTYEGGRYATEERRIDGELKPCVLLDSVASQANRMELALLRAWEEGRIELPVITVDFEDAGLIGVRRITSLEAPHRIADAILRDSELDGTPFPKTEYAEEWGSATYEDATALFELCPTALIFGTWGSPLKPGGLGAKFARAIASEIVGVDVVQGATTSSRIDPLNIQKNAATLYPATESGWPWTLEESEAWKKGRKLGKDGKPSEANHGNVTPSVGDGSFTMGYAVQTSVLSLPALRRLRFPLDGEHDPEVDAAARYVLAALALAAAALANEEGYDLRSRCALVPVEPATWELVGSSLAEVEKIALDGRVALEVYADAVASAKKAGLPFLSDGLLLRPSSRLVDLVARSQELARNISEGE